MRAHRHGEEARVSTRRRENSADSAHSGARARAARGRNERLLSEWVCGWRQAARSRAAAHLDEAVARAGVARANAIGRAGHHAHQLIAGLHVAIADHGRELGRDGRVAALTRPFDELARICAREPNQSLGAPPSERARRLTPHEIRRQRPQVLWHLREGGRCVQSASAYPTCLLPRRPAVGSQPRQSATSRTRESSTLRAARALRRAVTFMP